MKQLSTGIIAVLACVILCSLFCSCSSSQTGTIVDYGDATAFETALNQGENLENKTLIFTVTELRPNSKLGFNVCGGEHLNFISAKNPNLKVGDTVGVKATEISNLLGSWVIKYEIIDNPVIGETTIVSNETDNTQPTNQDSVAMDRTTEDPVVSEQEESSVVKDTDTNSDVETNAEADSEDNNNQSPVEIIDSNLVAFRDSLGNPKISAYVAFKNISDKNIAINRPVMDYKDDDGKLLTTDQFAVCIPEVAKPGQVFYLYSYHFNIKGIDYSNGFNFRPDGKMYAANNFFEVDISDVSFNGDSPLGIVVTAQGTNNTDKKLSGKPGAVFYDKDDKVVGFCYGLDSYEANQTKSFQIFGDMMSDEYDPSIVDHVEVFLQGNSY